MLSKKPVGKKTQIAIPLEDATKNCSENSKTTGQIILTDIVLALISPGL